MLTPLRPQRQRFRLPPLLPLISGGFLLAALILLGVEVFRFVRDRNGFLTKVTVAGVGVAGMDHNAARRVWELVYAQPVEMDYVASPIMINPWDVDFRIHSEDMLKELQRKD